MRHVYGVANRKGGQGKSTTVGTLARLCAMQGARVLVLDLAQPGSTTTSFRDLWPEIEHIELSRCLLAFRDVPSGAVPDVALAHEALQECGLPVRLNAMPSWGGGYVGVLPHDELLSEAAAYLQSDHVLPGLLAAMQDDYDLAIVDYPVDGVSLLANALAATRRVIMPLVPEAPALEGADAMLRLLARVRQGGHQIGLAGILLTRCDPRNRRAADVVRTLTQSGEVEGEPLHRKLFPFAVRSSEFFEQAFRHGVPIWERTEDPAHWAGYALLAEWLLRDAGLGQLAAAPRLAMALDATTRVLDSMGIAIGKPEMSYQDFRDAHDALSA